jgi:probable rRNA maturation factor
MRRPPDPLRLEISGVTGSEHIPYVRRNLTRAHAILNPAALREMALALVGNRKMAELHQQFMGIAGPTDVLTFESEHDARGRPTAGEVAVCVPYARRQAQRHRTGLRNELLLYALHGMLHLCGYDDRTARDFSRMHRREDQILTALGIGPVFAPTPRPRLAAPATGRPQRRRPANAKRRVRP